MCRSIFVLLMCSCTWPKNFNLTLLCTSATATHPPLTTEWLLLCHKKCFSRWNNKTPPMECAFSCPSSVQVCRLSSWAINAKWCCKKRTASQPLLILRDVLTGRLLCRVERPLTKAILGTVQLSSDVLSFRLHPLTLRHWDFSVVLMKPGRPFAKLQCLTFTR